MTSLCSRFDRLHAFAVTLSIGCVLLGGVTWGEENVTFEPDDAGYQRVVAPFLKAHCVRCHGEKLAEGEFRVDTELPNDFLNLRGKERWGEVVNVLNSHEMPPEGEPQPDVNDVGKVVDWVAAQMARAELLRRDSAIVLRRLNRAEYRNTVRDLIGVDFDTAGFPEDPAAGGFDNNGGVLSLSPLQMELYLDAARSILDLALVEGPQPPSITWRFQPEVGDGDSSRVVYDGQRAIVHGGKNPVDGDFKVMHHESWDRHLNARDFQVPHAGEYVVRVRAAGKVPSRDDVVASATRAHEARVQQRMKERPEGEKYYREEMNRDLEHFRTDRMYDYGPPRLKLIRNLGGQPVTIAEYDVSAPLKEPGIYTTRTRMESVKAGLTIEYAYDLPKVLENFWMQGHDTFARPELWVDWFELEGPLYESWPPPSHQRIMGSTELPDNATPEIERVQARRILADFMPRAYRRPVTAAEIDAKLALYDLVRPEAPSFIQAMKTPLSSVLTSPHFLFLVESSPVVPKNNAEQSSPSGSTSTSTLPHRASSVRPLNDYELACRLSYFLWSTMPDAKLTQLAAQGSLHQPDVLRGELRRLLADPKSEAFVKNFSGQWLGLREVGANPPAADLFPRYDRHLELSIVAESEAFFREILQHDLNVTNFIKSDFVVINERLARFYGIPDVRGDNFRRVAVPAGVSRGGIPTQASVLTITSNGTRTSPVKRGTWIMKNLLGIDPGLPVANAGDIAPKVPGIDKATVRQRLEIHRSLPLCARCHNKIDPLGFALENFNAAGEWRTQEGFGYKGRIGRDDPVIDASAKMLDGTEFVGVTGLQEVMLKQEDLFLRCLTEKLLTYALGRELGHADRPTTDQAVQHLKEHNKTLHSLIEFIVLSEPFLTK
ncbi:MAG: DUF1592 domain-containing protein [Planctomycetaceae bacterium]